MSEVVQECVSELEVAALFFAEEERASIVEDGFDSRACWARVSNEAPRGFRWLPLVVERMLSIQDGTGQVGRDLGTFQKLLSAHAGLWMRRELRQTILVAWPLHVPSKRRRRSSTARMAC